MPKPQKKPSFLALLGKLYLVFGLPIFGIGMTLEMLKLLPFDRISAIMSGLLILIVILGLLVYQIQLVDWQQGQESSL